MDLDWLKMQMDKLRAEASRGPVRPAFVFDLTNPIMGKIALAPPDPRIEGWSAAIEAAASRLKMEEGTLITRRVISVIRHLPYTPKEGKDR